MLVVSLSSFATSKDSQKSSPLIQPKKTYYFSNNAQQLKNYFIDVTHIKAYDNGR